MSNLLRLRSLSTSELHDLMENGDRVALSDLVNQRFCGTSLGLAHKLEPWVKFFKSFVGDEDKLRGFNLPAEQTPISSEWSVRAGDAYGWFIVQQGMIVKRFADTATIDYRFGGNKRLDPVRFAVDPLVFIDEHTLLGRSYVVTPLGNLPTPSFFSLHGPVPIVDGPNPPNEPTFPEPPQR